MGYNEVANAYISGINYSFLGIPVMSVTSTLAFTFWGLGVAMPSLSFTDKCRYWMLRLVGLMIGLLPPYRRSVGRALLATLKMYGDVAEQEMTATCSPLAISLLLPLVSLLLVMIVMMLGLASILLFAESSHQRYAEWHRILHHA